MFATIKKGRFELLDGRDNVAVSVAPAEYDVLIGWFVRNPEVLAEGFSCSSSVDFSSEDGWPNDDARGWLDAAMADAAREVNTLRARHGLAATHVEKAARALRLVLALDRTPAAVGGLPIVKLDPKAREQIEAALAGLGSAS